ncbi:hypothetical protein AAFF_G00274730 [Aldrovandia affinis]|uniref:Uncharacterized protein n=1 Tax=Aldrovandia affinis TaxID=143900 RepID=A0AAD7STQ9_9TELE|nr:hypothetical protein AAFF_G00274730 [Aldrovandia affinis]
MLCRGHHAGRHALNHITTPAPPACTPNLSAGPPPTAQLIPVARGAAGGEGVQILHPGHGWAHTSPPSATLICNRAEQGGAPGRAQRIIARRAEAALCRSPPPLIHMVIAVNL